MVEYTILDDPLGLIHHIRTKLTSETVRASNETGRHPSGQRRSAVLMAVTLRRGVGGANGGEPCLILNKRSRKVRQAGDLCFPGGGIHILDKALSKLLQLPGSPLGTGAFPTKGASPGRPIPKMTRLLLATSLREAWEEMRLNPLRVRFLGALPMQRLVIFDRLIQPLVAWVRPGQRFRPNWEVSRIVYIPLRNLLDRRNYRRYQLTFNSHVFTNGQGTKEFPCFFHQGRVARELLWGASYRIAMDFLRLAFDFTPPEIKDLPTVKATLDPSYLNGSRLAKP